MRLHVIRDIYRVLAGRDDLGDKLDLNNEGDNDARNAAARFSRGSVSIQSGYFVTAAELDRERNRARAHAFPD
ncbi:hypothetical protein [Shinella sp.]|uniref:hypothetical protein n=1 Tax=Shinella sp. TaxID=1870904 RepID=UPI00289CC724|nr:hypothetical protein [Shinella sp.]